MKRTTIAGAATATVVQLTSYDRWQWLREQEREVRIRANIMALANRRAGAPIFRVRGR
jgi:hypothetical protein